LRRGRCSSLRAASKIWFVGVCARSYSPAEKFDKI